MIEFSIDDLNKEHFTQAEYEDMHDAFLKDELYVIGVKIADKTCKYLTFNEEQIDRWRTEIIRAISISNINKLPKNIDFETIKQLLNSTYLSSIQNYDIAEKKHQGSLKHPPS